MGITKQYLRYVSGPMFGVIGSEKNIHLITKSTQKGKFVVVSACEYVFLWDLRRKVKVLTFHCEDVCGIVTAIEPRPPLKGFIDNTHIAAGYSDGSLVLYDVNIGHPIKFNGHKGGITTIAWDHQGMKVASASEDGEIVLWDMVTERGIIRLRGHKGKINKVRFLETRNVLLSCGSDMYLKFWDLDTNFCFYTLTIPSTKGCDFLTFKNDTRLLTGGDGNLTVWDLNFVRDGKEENVTNNSSNTSSDPKEEEPSLKLSKVENGLDNKTSEINGEEEINLYLDVKILGHLSRTKNSRICSLTSDGRTIAVQEKSSNIDLYIILNEEESRAKMAKRLKKNRKRMRNQTSETEDEETFLTDEIKQILNVKASSGVNGISVTTLPDGTIKMAILQDSNSISLYTTHTDSKALNEGDKLEEENLYLPGHRAEIRSIKINSIGDQIVTASADSLKVWDRKGMQAIKSIECNYPLCLLLPKGDRHILIGTKSGKLQLFDLFSGALLEDLEVPSENENKEKDSSIWALDMLHDGTGFVSGGSDGIVRFWNFELVEDTISGRGKRLSIYQDSKALKVADQITSIKCSSNGNFLAVATFDLKETLYFMDTLKLKGEFYGKSMPSTCLDFSSDSTLFIAGSKDSCIRLYASDYQDQKRLLKNCHQGGVTDVKFIANTHLFFSCGNDGTVKQWDADNFERIITLNGHQGIVRCLAINANGSFVATAGKDRSIRIWEKTNEPLVLEDSRAEERRIQEEEFIGGTIQTPVIAGEKDVEAVRPTKISKDTERAADELYEALNIYQEQKEGGQDKKPNQLMSLVYKTEDPLKFVLLVLRKIKSSELEEAILILPLNLILVLLVCIKGFITRKWDIELSTRVLVTAIRTNMNQLMNCKQSSPILRLLGSILPQATQNLQDMIGFNCAGLLHMMNRTEKRSETQLFMEAAQNLKDGRRRGKRKERITKRALLTI